MSITTGNKIISSMIKRVEVMSINSESNKVYVKEELNEFTSNNDIFTKEERDYLIEEIFKEIGIPKSAICEINIHKLVGSVNVHEDEEFATFFNADNVYMKVLSVQKLNYFSRFKNLECLTPCLVTRENMRQELYKNSWYSFKASKEHGITSNHAITVLTVWSSLEKVL